MTAGRYDMTIEQGATFYLPLTYSDSNGSAIDLSTYTAMLQVRRTPTTPVVTELSTENDRIVLGGADGSITLSMLAEDTADLPAGSYRYDLVLTSGASKTRLLEGTCTVKPRITV